MTLSRRTFGKMALGAGLAAGLPLAARASNAKYRLRYATAFPASHPGAKRIVEAADLIRKDTNGLVDLQVYPGSQLGSEADLGHRRDRDHNDGRAIGARSDGRGDLEALIGVNSRNPVDEVARQKQSERNGTCDLDAELAEQDF